MDEYTDAQLDHMHTDGLLCAVCQERPHTQRAQYHDCFICDICAEGEPTPEDEETNQ